MAKKTIYKAPFFGFDSTFLDCYELDVCGIIEVLCTSIHVQTIVHYTSSRLIFQLGMAVIPWLLFLGHPSSHLIGFLLLDLHFYFCKNKRTLPSPFHVSAYSCRDSYSLFQGTWNSEFCQKFTLWQFENSPANAQKCEFIWLLGFELRSGAYCMLSIVTGLKTDLSQRKNRLISQFTFSPFFFFATLLVCTSRQAVWDLNFHLFIGVVFLPVQTLFALLQKALKQMKRKQVQHFKTFSHLLGMPVYFVDHGWR